MLRNSLIFSLLVLCACVDHSEAGVEKLMESLTFYASFDESVDAFRGAGDIRMYTTMTRKMEDAKIGQHREDVSLDSSAGNTNQ